MAVQAPVFPLLLRERVVERPWTILWTALNGWVNGVERVLNELHLKPVHKCQILGPGA